MRLAPRISSALNNRSRILMTDSDSFVIRRRRKSDFLRSSFSARLERVVSGLFEGGFAEDFSDFAKEGFGGEGFEGVVVCAVLDGLEDFAFLPED